MSRKATREPDSSLIYPGIYKTPEISRKSQLTRVIPGAKKIKAEVKLSESPEDITIQLSAPGFVREDFVVMVQNWQLSVYALHRKSLNQEFEAGSAENCDYILNRHLLLPENVDTDFVSAEYRNGILWMHFLKSCNAGECKRHQVAVY